MADISKITVPIGGTPTELNFKDSDARTSLSSKMDKANPTGTGALSLNRKENTTVGQYSSAEGENCEASGSRSHAEGEGTIASGRASHAENYLTTASGNRSHAEGTGTIAQNRSQHVFGEYNSADPSTGGVTARGTYAEIVGNGTSDSARSNARTLDWDGNEVLAGNLKINGNQDVAVKSDLDITTLLDTPAPIQTFADGGDNIPMKSCEVAIVAQQAGTGTPAPDNIRAITGFDAVDVEVCGKNFSQITETSGSHNGITYTFNDDGTISASGSVPSGNSYKNVGHFILQAGTYTISGLPLILVAEARKCAMVLCKDAYSGSVNIIKTIYSNVALSDQFTLTEATDCYLRIYIYTAAGNISDVILSPQIELSNEATAYETHKGTTHTITLTETIYGGTAELVGGNGSKTWEGLTNLANGDWSSQGEGDYQFFALYVSGADTTRLAELLCNKYRTLTPGLTNTDDNIVGIISSGTVLRIRDKRYNATTINDFKTSLSDCVVIFPKATPTAFTFTGANIPTLSGANNVYADSGDINALTYFNDKADDIASMVRLMTRT